MSGLRTISMVNIHKDRSELDSHTDTCVIGKNALITHDFNRPVSTTGYDQSQGTIHRNMKTVSAALAYDCPRTGQVIILMVNQAIHIPTMENNLLCPMQIRMNDVKVSEIPKFLADNPTDETHAITFQDGEASFIIPLSLDGVTSVFPTRKPTMEEYNNGIRFDLTYESPVWDPHSSTFSDRESNMVGADGLVPETSQSTHRPITLAGLQTEYMTLGQTLAAHAVSATTTAVEPGMSPAKLAKNWGIGLETAKQTLKVTTQRGVRTVLHPSLSRRYRTNDRQLRYRRLGVELFSDTMEANTRSRRGNKYAQIFCARNGWIRAFPMKKKSCAHEGLSTLFARDGVPPAIIVDGALEQTQGEFRRKARESGCHIKTIEPLSPWMNAGESGIRESKRGCGRKMLKAKSPKKLWDYCLELECYIRSNTAHDIFDLQGEVPETIISGDTSDITLWAEYGWYDWVYMFDSGVRFPDDKEVLGRYLGPSLDYTPAMTARILKSNGEVVHRSTFRPLTQEEWDSPTEKEKRRQFDEQVEEVLGESVEEQDYADDPDIVTPSYETYEDDDDQKVVQVPDVDDVPDFDMYLDAEVMLPKGDKQLTGKVKRQKRERDGTLKGTAHKNPILDTRVYEVEFPDGEIAEYAANVLAQNMISQCDLEGNQFLLMDSIVDHKKDGHAVELADQYVYVNGRQHQRKTTKGWKLCVQWKDGTTTWERLADLKESYPVEVAEYAVVNKISHEPAFSWWVPHMLKKRDRIIAAVNKRYHKRSHKYGIRLPHSVEEALAIDKETGTDYWFKAIKKEMDSVRVAFQLIEDPNEKIKPGFKAMKCHMVFDIKIEDFRRKARLVAGGHMVDAPDVTTYSSVVSRESVRIALTLAALNDLEVKTSDIQNAYLTAPCAEKIWTECGPEFGSDQGKRAYIVRSLYGLKSAGATFRHHLADCMRHLGYKSCLADPDVWYKSETRPEDGFGYYSYMLLYVDDVLAIHHNAEEPLRELDRFFKMKEGSIGDPTIYLGAKLKQMTLANGVVAWGISPSKYIQDAVKNVENYLAENMSDVKLPSKAPTPFVNDYAPELDVTPELDPEKANYFQTQIGVLRWIVELGRIDILTETSMLASHLALPREGHLEAVFRIFGYLKNKHNSRLCLDPTYPTIDLGDFVNCDWKDFYGDAQEAIPPNAPIPKGKEVDLRMFVDSDHAGEKRTRRSRTGFLIYLNMAPIAWYSKRQSTIETSVFGAEFVAMKVGMETLRGIRYKLRMMGVPLTGPSYIYGDNMSVIHNTQRPESTLKKKSNSICYHAIREAVAMGECLTGHVSTHKNPADLCTKVVPGGMKRDFLISLILYDLVDDHL